MKMTTTSKRQEKATERDTPMKMRIALFKKFEREVRVVLSLVRSGQTVALVDRKDMVGRHLLSTRNATRGFGSPTLTNNQRFVIIAAETLVFSEYANEVGIDPKIVHQMKVGKDGVLVIAYGGATWSEHEPMPFAPGGVS